MAQNDHNFNMYRDVSQRLGESVTAYNELLVAVPKGQIDLKAAYPLSQLRDESTSVSGGNVVQEDGKFVCSTDSTGTSSITFRSVEHGRYVAGFDAVAGMAVAVPTAPIENQVVEWGYTDFVNGFVVGLDADGLYTAVYSGGVKYGVTRREDWYDSLDSGDDAVDPSNLNVYRINFRYYGKGPFELKILSTDRKGKGIMRFATSTSKLPDADPIVVDPNLPLSIKIDNNGTTTNPLTANVVGRQFHIVGDYNPNKRITAETIVNAAVPNTDFVPLVSFRQRTDDLAYDSIATKLGGIDFLSTENLVFQVRVYSILTGAVFASPTFSNSGVESALQFDTSATAITNGIKIYEGLVAGGGGNKATFSDKALPNAELPSGGSTIDLCAKSLGAAATVTATLRVSEEW